MKTLTPLTVLVLMGLSMSAIADEARSFESCTVTETKIDNEQAFTQSAPFKMISNTPSSVVYEAKLKNRSVRFLHNRGEIILDAEKFNLAKWAALRAEKNMFYKSRLLDFVFADGDARVIERGDQSFLADVELSAGDTDLEVYKKLVNEKTRILFSDGSLEKINGRIVIECPPL